MTKPRVILQFLRIPADIASLLSAFQIAYWARKSSLVQEYLGLSPAHLLPPTHFWWFSFQAALLFIILMVLDDNYRLCFPYHPLRDYKKTLSPLGATFTIIILYFFVMGIRFFSRFILGSAFALTLLFCALFRIGIWSFQRWCLAKQQQQIVILGGDTTSQREIKNDLSFQLKKNPFCSLQSILDSSLNHLNDVIFFLQSQKIDKVIQLDTPYYAPQLIEYCQLNGIEYSFVPSLLDVQKTHTKLEFLGDIPVIQLRPTAIDWTGRVMKRAFDLILAFCLLVALSPLLFLVALAVKLQDGGPIFYKSTRVTRDKHFSMWKFRSMVINAEHLKASLQDQNRRKGPLFKVDHDPRITRVGRFLRKTSLDELPQLWNVIKGDMSLVGPRAHLPAEIEQYEKHHRRVLAVKAGITGLAQVSGRSRLDFEQEVKLDVYYIENWSLWLDIKILFSTFSVLFDGE